jgi:hypothetical protein
LGCLSLYIIVNGIRYYGSIVNYVIISVLVSKVLLIDTHVLSTTIVVSVERKRSSSTNADANIGDLVLGMDLRMSSFLYKTKRSETSRSL